MTKRNTHKEGIETMKNLLKSIDIEMVFLIGMTLFFAYLLWALTYLLMKGN